LEGDVVRLSDEQARAILALTLSRLTGLGRDEIFGEARTLAEAIRGFLEILASREKIMGIVRDELVEVRTSFAVPRRTEIVDGDADVEDEDLITREEMVITVTHGGYVKRTALATYRTQHRGGKGRSGMSMKEEDAVTRVFSANTHAPVLFFTSAGKVYKMKVWRLPVGLPNSRGKAFVNLLPIEPGDTITSILPLPEDEATWDQFDVMFATRSGGVRRNKLSDFVQINRNGKIAMKLDEGDSIVGVGVCNAEVNDILLTTAIGRCIRFPVEEVRVFAGRDSTGVRGIRLGDGDRVISMAILRAVAATPAERLAYLRHASAMRTAVGEAGDGEEAAAAPEEEEIEGADAAVSLGVERIADLGAAEEFILTVSTEGFGKRTSAYDFRRTGRGGQGLIAQDLTKRGGRLAASFPAEDADEILLVTDQGQLIRTPVTQIRIAGRNTQGVTIFRKGADEHVVSVERLVDTGEAEAEAEAGDEIPPEAGAGEAPDA
jgi:DNA gyrase subunit A